MTGPARDCFAYGGKKIGVRAAQALLADRIAPATGVETVSLALAAGRCLAEAVTSPRNVPSFDNAAVDGYAFAFQDGMRETGATLTLAAGRAAAGHPYRGMLPAGHALRVLTGAMMPAGADTVALQEEVAATSTTAIIPAGLKGGANRRLAGEDIRAGRPALQPGTRLRPQDIGLAAELGRASLSVFAPLKVAILSTGDEIVEPGAGLPEGGVYDANRYILKALLQSLPVVVTDFGILRDDPDLVDATLRAAAADHHVILTSGGASRGDEDHVVRSVAASGRLDFWQIAMKPGRPLAFGQLGRTVFVGLPGNPVAAMACFLLFGRPVLLRLSGAEWRVPAGLPVPADFSVTKQAGRSEYLRATLTPDEHGRPLARRIEREGSGMLTSLVEAQGLVEIDAEVRSVAPGDLVLFMSFAELGVPV
jgi:molybdopterin molybdotransferase